MPARLAVVALVFSLTSCATVITGKHDVLNVNSSPTGASFTTSTGAQGTTPAKIEVPDDVDVEFRFQMPGYADGSVTAAKYMSGWVWGNILIGGIIGLVIDFASGGIYTHDRDVSITLAPAAPQS
jgi:hypothetical protein